MRTLLLVAAAIALVIATPLAAAEDPVGSPAPPAPAPEGGTASANSETYSCKPYCLEGASG